MLSATRATRRVDRCSCSCVIGAAARPRGVVAHERIARRNARTVTAAADATDRQSGAEEVRKRLKDLHKELAKAIDGVDDMCEKREGEAACEDKDSSSSSSSSSSESDEDCEDCDAPAVPDAPGIEPMAGADGVVDKLA